LFVELAYPFAAADLPGLPPYLLIRFPVAGAERKGGPGIEMRVVEAIAETRLKRYIGFPLRDMPFELHVEIHHHAFHRIVFKALNQ